jgi:hypothetical protein
MSEVNICPDLSCFDDIIGLSLIDCVCFPENDYKTSKSCLYLDQAEGMQLRQIDALKDCGNDNDLWLLMDTARTKAIKRFVAETQAQMGTMYSLARTMFNGYLGRQQVKYMRTLSHTYAGVRFRAGQVVGGSVKITAINTIFEATGTITLDIYNSLNEHLYSMLLDTQAGTMHHNHLSTPITLPLWDGRCDYLDYIFIYTYSSANKPYDNKLSCCGRSYNFNCEKPYYKQKSNKLEGWASWFMAGNIEVDSLDFSDLCCTTGDYMNGLQFELQTYCDTAKTFCFDTPNIQDVQFASVAHAILHAAAAYLCIDLMTSTKINYYTLINREQLEGVRQYHEAEYLKLVTYLVANVDLRNTDCFICKDRIGMGRAML